MTEVTLTFGEILVAGNAGVLRQVNALKQRLHDPDSHHRDPLEAHVSGAIAELAVCKHFGCYWNPTVGITWAGQVPGDSGHIEVRSTPLPNGCLLMHQYSFDDRPYLLVLTHRSPVFQLAGWILGRDGKQDRWWRPTAPRPAFFVPQSELAPADSLSQ